MFKATVKNVIFIIILDIELFILLDLINLLTSKLFIMNDYSYVFYSAVSLLVVIIYSNQMISPTGNKIVDILSVGFIPILEIVWSILWYTDISSYEKHNFTNYFVLSLVIFILQAIFIYLGMLSRKENREKIKLYKKLTTGSVETGLR